MTRNRWRWPHALGVLALLVLFFATPARAQTANCTGIAAWSATTTYAAGVQVTYQGSLYKALVATTNVAPNYCPSCGWWQSLGTCGSVATCTAAPSVPTGLSSPSKASDSVSLTWAAASAGNGCSISYDVYRGGTKVLTVPTASATISGLAPNTAYSFSVAAVDQAGSSAQSAALPVTTSAVATVVVPAYGSVIRMESLNMPGWAIRHSAGRLRTDTVISPMEDAEWRLVPGLADAGAVSFESVNFPGEYLRHRNGEIWRDASDGSAGFKADATWRVRAGLANSALYSFESYNFGGEYLRHRDYLLWRTAIGSDLDRNDATFRIWNFDWSWVKGAVFVPTNVTNEIQQWDQYDPAQNDRELHYASIYGINCVRVFLHYLVWENNKTRFLANIEDFLQRADNYGIKVEFVFFDDCWGEHPVFGSYPPPLFGIHNSRWQECPGADIKGNYAAYKARLQAYVQDVVNAHKFDRRMAFWEPFNEPGNGESGLMFDVTNQILRDSRDWIKATGTDIPITSTDFAGTIAPSVSDFYSWHPYNSDYPGPRAKNVLNTESMNRGSQSVPGIVSNFGSQGDGYIMWEFGIGRDNCRYPWGDTTSEPNTPFHGIIYPDGHPWSLGDVTALRGDDLSSGPFFNVDYYANTSFSDRRKSSVTPMIDFDLGNEFGTGSPDASVGIGTDNFSTRWTGSFLSQGAGSYSFSADGDNIVRVWVGSTLVINKTGGARATVSGSLSLAANTSYDLKVEYVHATGDASLHLQYAGPGIPQQVLMGRRGFHRFESSNITGDFIRHASGRARIDGSVVPLVDSEWYVVPGLADSSAVSLESVNFPGQYLRHRNGEVWKDANDGSSIFAADATWYPRTGLANAAGVSFESYNFRGEYIRHSNYLLWRQPISTDLDRSDATFFQR